MYWEHGPLFGGPKFFNRRVMSRNKFLNIQKFIRFAPPQHVDKRNPRTRIEAFLNLLRERCSAIIHAGRNIAVDESLILWKGLLKFKQCIRYVKNEYLQRIKNRKHIHITII